MFFEGLSYIKEISPATLASQLTEKPLPVQKNMISKL